MVNFIVDIFKACLTNIGNLLLDSWPAKDTYLLHNIPHFSFSRTICLTTEFGVASSSA